MNPYLMKMIEDAGRAPSGHNTQPWKFEVHENQITIRPNFERRLEVVDQDDHALYISLGCALENMILSARAHGWSPKLSREIINSNDEILVDLKKSQDVERDVLYDYIHQRQCTRAAYDDTPVERSKLDLLAKEVKNETVDILYFTDKEKIKELKPFIIEGSNLQFNNKKFVNELVSWIRFNRKDAEMKRDGIWSSSMGLPNLPRTFGKLIMKHFVSAKSEAARWKKLINKSAGFALFVAAGNSKTDWVMLGRSLQRFGLKATQLELKHAHVNMPCEEISVRKKLIKHFRIQNGKQPLLLLRFGYSKTMPYSLRLLPEEVLVKSSRANIS